MLTRRAVLVAGAVPFCGVPAARVEAAAHQTGRSVILVFLKGGPTQLETFDPKPDAPADYRGAFGTVATSAPGTRFCEHVPRLAAAFRRFSVIRSVTHNLSEHDRGQRYVLTGDRTATQASPGLGSSFAARVGWRVPPPYVAIPELRGYAGILGPRCDPFVPLGDSGKLVLGAGAPGAPTAAQSFSRRSRLLGDLNERFRVRLPDDPGMVGHRQLYAQASDLLQSEATRRAIDLRGEPSRLREQYGTHPWGEYLLLARRLVEAGRTFVTVVLDGWDTHYHAFSDLKQLLPPLDQALAALIEDLAQRGMLERTVVLAFGEFGRTPLVNPQGGRDHWARAMSVLWAGGGARGGQTVGATDSKAAEPTESPYSPTDLAYTLFQQLGIPPDELRYTPEGRRLFSGGKRIGELF